MKIKLQIIFVSFFIFVLSTSAQQAAKKFDEIGQINCDDVKVRLNALAVELQNNHSKSVVERRTENHLNGIEGLWSKAQAYLI